MTKAEVRVLQTLSRHKHGVEWGRIDEEERSLKRKGMILVMDNPGGGCWPYRVYITTKGEQALAIEEAKKGRRAPKRARIKYKRAPQVVMAYGRAVKV